MHQQLSHSALRRSGAIPRSDESRQAKSQSARRQYSLLAKSSMSPAAPPRFPHSIPTTAPRLGTQIKETKGRQLGAAVAQVRSVSPRSPKLEEALLIRLLPRNKTDAMSRNP